MTNNDIEVLAEIDQLFPGPAMEIEDVEFDGSPGFDSAFDVDTAAMASAGAAVVTAGGSRIDSERVKATFVGNVLVNGEPIPKWSDLSGYYRTSKDRHLQFHCNFPHHAAGVVSLLGCEPERAAVQEAVLDWDPVELETALIERGMIAAYLRTINEWSQHPHAVATRDLPLISVTQIGEAAPRPLNGPARVLDCSRVLAGPIAGQTLASQGADVLRVGSAGLPSVELCVIVSGAGKRNTNVDLTAPDGRSTFAGLLSEADIWIDAYRPGALDGHGFGIDAVTPGSVVVQLCAFDTVGPWADRRGFDSIVQSTTGIVEAGRSAAGADAPTPLPVQALDYATGLLAAAAATKVRAHQAEVGGTWRIEVSLLRTRNWLVGLGGPAPFTPSQPAVSDEAMTTIDSSFGAVTVPRPLSGEFALGPQALGSAEPAFVER